MNEREQSFREPQGEQAGPYEARASSAAPPPTRERERDTMEAVDERASTTKTEPMGRLGARSQAPPPEREAQRSAATAPAPAADGSALLQDGKLEHFASQWDVVQAGFVDDPRRTVEQADRLVAEVIDHLAKVFRDERERLQGRWSQDGEADTEELRKAMQRYRDFFRTLVGR